MTEKCKVLLTDVRVAVVLVIAVVNHFALGSYAYQSGLRAASGENRIVNDYREQFRTEYARLLKERASGKTKTPAVATHAGLY